MDKRLLKIIKKELNIEPENIYEIDGPLDLTVLMKIYGLEGFDHLKTPKYEPQQSELPAGCNIFEEIRKGRYPLTSSVPELYASGGFHPSGGERSGSTGYQTDLVSCQRQFSHYCGIGSGRRERQAGHSTGGTESPFR